MPKVRIERDTFGDIEVPAERLWGAQTQRSLEYFSIGRDLMPREMISAYAILKRAAAVANHAGGRLESATCRLITHVCDEIIDGKHREMFPLHVWTTGSGTQFNTNINEVISNRCCQLVGTPLGSKRPIHPDDHVNMSQSSNDSFASAMYIAAAIHSRGALVPAVTALKDAIAAKAAERGDVIATMLADDLERIELALAGLYCLALGGTAEGTGFNAASDFAIAATAEIARFTGLRFVTAPGKFAAQAAHDGLVHLSSSLRMLGVSLCKIANDMNPTQAEALTMIAVQAMASDIAVRFGGAGGYLERNVCNPLMIAGVLQSVAILSGGCGNFRKYLIESPVAAATPSRQPWLTRPAARI